LLRNFMAGSNKGGLGAERSLGTAREGRHDSDPQDSTRSDTQRMLY